MAKSRSLTLKFPLGGINRRMAFQDQPPYTTPYAINVWPDTNSTQRARGGTRPGTATALDGYGQTFSSLTNVRMWAEINIVPTDTGFEKVVLVADDGVLKKHNNGNGTWTTISSSLSLSTTRNIQAVGFLQKLYIADWGVTASGSNGVVTTNTTFDDNTDGPANWTTVADNTGNYVLQIYNTSSAGTYLLSAVASGSMTLASSAGNNTGLVWRITRSLKVFDLATSTLSILTPTAGTAPHGCRLVNVFGERLVWGNDGKNPQVWYMSRVSDALDYEYGEEDKGSAVAGNEIFRGKIGEPLTALIPHNKGCFVFGTAIGTYILRGDPTQQGSEIERLHYKIGPCGPDAWCKDSADYTWFLSYDGLYKMAPGCGSTPESVSREVLPEEFLVITEDVFDNTTIQMAYDFKNRAICIAGLDDMDVTEMWWYDVQRGGFWEMDYESPLEDGFLLLREYSLTVDTTRGGVIMISTNGTIAQSDTDVIDEDAAAFLVGPFRLSKTPLASGAVREIMVVCGENSTDLYNLTLYAGPSAESVCQEFNVSIFGTTQRHVNQWSVTSVPQDTQYTHYPMIGDHAGLIQISCPSLDKLTIEEISLIVTESGPALFYPA